MLTVIALGAVAGAFTLYNFDLFHLNLGFAILALITFTLGSRIVVQIPRVKSHISVSDTFVLLSMLLFGGEPAIILAGLDGFFISQRTAKKTITRAFNVSVFVCSTFLTVWALRLLFGPIPELARSGYTSNFVVAICVMAFTQYVTNSGLVAIGVALKAGEPIWQTWREKFLWTSLTYFAGASAAGIIAKLIGSLGIYAFLATAPIVAVIYFTYTTYLKNVEEAQKHVEQLSSQMAEQERISLALKESEEHFRTAFDHAVGMAMVSPDGHWLQVNASLCAMLGYTEAEMLAGGFRSVTHPADLGEAFIKMHQLLEGEVASYQLETRYLHKEGHVVWALQSASLVRDPDGRPRHLVFQVQDVTGRKRAEEQIHHAAFHDSLTGLPNRTRLADRLSLAVERAKRTRDYRFAILFVDLDRFKVVNDSLGHDLGDELLVELSRRLETCVRKIDMVARLGGDEFAVLLDGVEAPEDATDVATRLLETIAHPFDLNGHEFFTTGSIGIAYSASGYDRYEDILRDADTAMYRAKANGKNRFEAFDARMHARAVEALRLENELRRAIMAGEVQPHYQPIIALDTGEITGFEALARWRHPERGLVSPADFIPLAEETGLIMPLGLSILRQSCVQLAEWDRAWPEERPFNPFKLSVNVSVKQLRQPGLVEEVRSILLETGVSPERLQLEITESALMEDAAAAIEMLRQMKAIGVRLAMDDFGTGYSSLSYLHRFPIDTLKIDRSFVTRMGTDRESRGIVKTIIMLANELGKEVVAEGVETTAQRDALAGLACGYAQGYLFSKPLDADGAGQLLFAAPAWLEGWPCEPSTRAEKIDSPYAM
ncbi:MAG TPA: EAL domain-containing protein [Pyrinomonadaceae bacterium]|nr:EAL domain-containing protein [Pyrinomonadaceae bacterium]